MLLFRLINGVVMENLGKMGGQYFPLFLIYINFECPGLFSYRGDGFFLQYWER